MSFTSLGFFGFLLAIFVVYYILPRKTQWIILLIASYTFYGIVGIKYLPFIIFTTISTFFAGIVIGRIDYNGKKKLNENIDIWTSEERKQFSIKLVKKKKLLLVTAMVLNFGILAFLKYFNFFEENLNVLLKSTGISLESLSFSLLIPIGISFYTFQAMGYLIDVYRGKHEPDHNLLKFALFVSFFPQIIQGPISRYDQLAKQLCDSHRFEFPRIKSGVQLILWGLFKKLVIADRAIFLVDKVFMYSTDYSGFVLFIAASLYGVQIYTDFSGGIDIARGVAQVLGIDMMENFKRPYFAKTISEFWQRWHISLGAWMRNYVFYPMALSKGVNRTSKWMKNFFGAFIGKTLPICIISIFTFLLVGIWHGASWKYVVYGLYYGGLISISILMEPLFLRFNKICKVNTECFSWKLFQMLRTSLLILLGRIITRADGVQQGLQIMRRMFSTWNPWVLVDGTLYELGLDRQDFLLLIVSLLILLIVGILQESGIKIRDTIARQNFWFQWTLIFLGIITILIFGVYGPEYIAKDFVYMQF